MKKFIASLAIGAFLISPALADSTIDALTAGAAVSATDVLPAVQGSDPAVKVTAAQIKTFTNLSAVDARTTVTEAVNNADQNKLVTFSNASAVAASIAQAGTAGSFAAGWAATLMNLGAGTVTLTPATSTIDGAATITLATNQSIDVYSDGTNYFTARGRGPVSFSVAGTSAMGTGAITSATCATVVTTTATGVLTTDIVTASFNGDPHAVTGYIPSTAGMLTIIAYPSAGNVNFLVCNNTSSSVTPGAITLNWRVAR